MGIQTNPEITRITRKTSVYRYMLDKPALPPGAFREVIHRLTVYLPALSRTPQATRIHPHGRHAC
jgi:hypothetical protein